MKARCRRLGFCSLVVVSIMSVLAFAPVPQQTGRGAAVADFVAPMPPHAAEASVARARLQQERQRVAARQAQAQSAQEIPADKAVYFAESGHHLTDRYGFLSYWRRQGGLMIFGFPISEEVREAGRVVQYFERARFEHHPEQENPEYRVQLALLGTELVAGRSFTTVPPGSGEIFFPETGHSTSGAFYDFWRKRGGTRVFGFPLSEPIQEVSPVDGQTRTVQYFERARFEHHPEALDPFYRDWADSYNLRLRALYEVQLGDLGRQVAARRGYDFGRVEQQPGVQVWTQGLWPRRIDINLTTQTLTAYEGEMPVFHAPVATGSDYFPTPTGTYALYDKYERQDMFGAAGGESWHVVNVPWVQYIVGGVALHGTYWHDQWGTGLRMSHGCINLNIDDAQWLYMWAELGTQVNILN